MSDQKEIIIVAPKDSAHLVCELPYLFKKAGFRVTVLAFPDWSLAYSSYIDELIDASPNPKEIIEEAALLLAKRSFEFKILASDSLIWALVDSAIDPALKMQLYPIANPIFLQALNGKVEVAALLKELEIPSPPSQAAQSLQEAASIAQEIGFPVILKVSRSGAGEGVYKCETEEEVMKASIATDQPFLIEKYLEGDLISVEPLFLASRLVAYSYSIMTYSPTLYAPSLERMFMPCKEIEPILQKLGEKLQLTGFFSLSFIREKEQKHSLFELDFRPNRWVRHGALAGVDWVKALQGSFPLQSPQSIKKVRHFQADLWHAIKTKQKDRIFYWLFNRNGSWKTIPFYDLKVLFGGAWHMMKKIT